jgi:hypothetical protein
MLEMGSESSRRKVLVDHGCMRRVLHLGHIDIFADCRGVLENLENCLKIILMDCCTISSFDDGGAALNDGVNSLKMLLTDCCTAWWLDDDREALIRYPLMRLLESVE